MEFSTIKKWIVFFAGILCAILVADACSMYVANAAGITGPVRLVVSFILYAAVFFAVLYAMEKAFSINFFGFGRR